MGPRHPFADQFPNRQAWRFERKLATLARIAQTAEGLQYWINRWPTLMARGRDPGVATAWRAFVDRKLAAVPWPANPEQVQAITTRRTRHAIQTLRRARPPAHQAGSVVAPPPAVVFRADTGERVPVAEADPYLRRAGPNVETARRVARPARSGTEVYVTQRQRAPGGPVPPGWVTEDVGRWHGRDTEVVYNPRRHQIMVTQVRSDTLSALEADGWQRHSTDGDRIIWTRDRLAATHAALARVDQAAAIEPPARELRPAVGLQR